MTENLKCEHIIIIIIMEIITNTSSPQFIHQFALLFFKLNYPFPFLFPHSHPQLTHGLAPTPSFLIISSPSPSPTSLFQQYSSSSLPTILPNYNFSRFALVKKFDDGIGEADMHLIENSIFRKHFNHTVF